MKLNFPTVFFLIFFVSYLILGVNLYRDYGISWDEPRNRINGLISLDYIGKHFGIDFIIHDTEVRENSVPLQRYFDRDYGVAFEVPVAFLERLIGYEDPQDIFFFRHLITFLTCSLACLAIYLLGSKRFNDWRLALLGALFFVLSPRFFAESFYNSKDLIFLSFFAISLFFTVKFLLNPTMPNAFYHAIASAVLIDIRIMGIIIPLITLAMLFLKYLKKEVGLRAFFTTITFYLLLCTLLIIAFWPYLWTDPLTNFIQAFKNMMRFRWNGYILYFGHIIDPTVYLPWHYLPVWISITTPLLYLVCFLWGSIEIVKTMVSRGSLLWNNDEEFQDVLFFGILYSAVLSVILLQSVLYDGWRQMYFIYPLLLLIAVRGWTTIYTLQFAQYGTQWRILIASFTLFCLVHTAIWMVKSHPFQNVYFNILTRPNKIYIFDVDYWGLSTRRSLELIAEYDKSERIKIWPGSKVPIRYGLLMLDKKDRNRFQAVKKEQDAHYVITNYRLIQTDYGSAPRNYTLFNEIIVDGEAILRIYKR